MSHWLITRNLWHNVQSVTGNALAFTLTEIGHIKCCCVLPALIESAPASAFNLQTAVLGCYSIIVRPFTVTFLKKNESYCLESCFGSSTAGGEQWSQGDRNELLNSQDCDSQIGTVGAKRESCETLSIVNGK